MRYCSLNRYDDRFLVKPVKVTVMMLSNAKMELKITKHINENNYLFLGWFEDPEYTQEFECNAITQNLEIYAKTIEMGTQYRITYNLNGGRFDSTFSNKYYLGEGFDLPIPVYNKYYQFDGWLLNGEKISTISQTMYGDITVDATWKDISKYYKKYSSTKVEVALFKNDKKAVKIIETMRNHHAI